MRLFITTLSLFSVISFGYALAGYGGSMFGGRMRMDYVLWGLLAGFAFAGLALWLWSRHKAEFFLDGTEGPERADETAQDGPGGEPGAL